MTAAATDLATIGSTLDAAHSAAAPPTLAVTPAAADEVSVGIADLFSQRALDFQALARQAAGFQEQFVRNLNTSAAAFTSIEDAIVSLLRGLETGISSVVSGYDNLVVNFISGSVSWIDFVPPPLQTFVVGIPFPSLFIVPLPFLFAIGVINAIIGAITG